MSKIDLRLTKVSKNFGATEAARDVSMDVFEGEFLTILGPSGCGKTTTLKLIAGLLEPDEGRIEIKGRDVTNVSPWKRDIGFVFQSYALFPHMTVFANIAYGLRVRKIHQEDIRQRVTEALNLVRLPALEQRAISELSGGQQQRVALARALVIQPSLLLLDEPLSNLDARLREDMRVELTQLQRRLGITTILVTHDQGEALTMSNRIVVMRQGRVDAIGNPTVLYRSPPTRFVAEFIGKNNFFEGMVSNGVVTTETGLQLFLGEQHKPMSTGKARISIRPESVIISEKRNGSDNVYQGEVDFVAYIGSLVQYTVRLSNGEKVIVESQGIGTKTQHHQGEKVWVEMPPNSLVIQNTD